MTRILRTTLLILTLSFVASAQASNFLPLDKATARHLVAAETHTQPTAVVLWSYDCPHCKKNLGQIAQLAKRYPQLKIISVATEPASPELKQRLDKTGLPGTRYAYGDDSPEALAYALDPTWHGELPRTLLLDGKGRKVAISGIPLPHQIKAALGF